MNAERYANVVTKQYPKWWTQARGPRNKSKMVILQDNERCLWSKTPRAAMRRLGMNVAAKFPPYSPDLNPVENCWRVLRQMLDESVPPEKETRRDHVRRIHRAVRRMHRRVPMLVQNFTANMKERDRAVIAAGRNRTKYCKKCAVASGV